MLKRVLFSLSSLTLAAQGAPSAQAAPAAKETPAQTAPAAKTAPAQPAPATPAPSAQAGQKLPVKTGMPATPEAPKPEPIPEDAVIGRIGSRIIHEKDLHNWMKAQVPNPKQLESYIKNTSMMVNIRQQFLERSVMAAKARKEGLNKLPEYKTAMAFQEDQVLVGMMMNPELKDSPMAAIKAESENPTEEEIQAYFVKNSQRFDTPEKFTARHILVGTKGAPRMGDKGLPEEEAKAKIAKIQEELKAGKKWEDAAKEYSDDPSNKNTGGLIKDASFGGFAKEFEEAVHKQEIGKVGDPVKTNFGYHLIIVDERKPKQTADLEQVRDKVKQQMAPEKRNELTKKFIEDCKKEVDFVAGSDAEKSQPKPAAKTPKAAKGKAKTASK